MDWEKVIGVPLITLGDIRKWVPSYFDVYLTPKESEILIEIVSPHEHISKILFIRKELFMAVPDPLVLVKRKVKETLIQLIEEDAKWESM